MPADQFIFAVCQVGMEWALKEEIARRHAALHFAYSRPGFVTFKSTGEATLSEEFQLSSIFARTYGLSLGSVRGDSPGSMASDVVPLCQQRKFHHLHVWQRDERPVGDRGFEPAVTTAAVQAGQSMAAALSPAEKLPVNQLAKPRQDVLDCVLVEPDQWWIGWHRTVTVPSRWPGGVLPVEPPEEMVSRAYLKMVEALAWADFSIQPGEPMVEIGSAPGGAAQALLERELVVTGIDPANVDPRVMNHPRFTHIKKRGADLKRREYSCFRWLTADLNVAPNYTLDTLQDIVTHDEVHIRGMLITLKMLDRSMVGKIDEYLARIRSWGYQHVRARQLAYNRQEVCVAALRRRSMRREPRWKRN